jgi:outer membrane protein TolC
MRSKLHGGLFLALSYFAVVSVGLAQAQNPPPAQPAGIKIDLKQALEQARANSPALRSAALDVTLAMEERLQAKSALLPSVDYSNQYLYTQGNGSGSQIFVSNDGVHVYNSQAVVHQDLFSPERLAEYRRSIAAQALAAAKRDVTERGIVGAVVQNYYGLSSAQRKLASAIRSVAEARSFVDITSKLETGGEVPHSDVLKAQLVLQQRQRDLQETQLAIEKARIELAVLLFPDFRLDFDVVDDLEGAPPLPAFEEIEKAAREKSPDLRVA